MERVWFQSLFLFGLAYALDHGYVKEGDTIFLMGTAAGMTVNMLALEAFNDESSYLNSKESEVPLVFSEALI